MDDLIGYAEQLELDVERFVSDLHEGVGDARIADDVAAYDIDTLSQAGRAAGARAMFART